MRLKYLPANQAWCFCFGDSIVSMDGQHIFTARADAVAAAARCNLTVTPQGRII